MQDIPGARETEFLKGSDTSFASIRLGVSRASGTISPIELLRLGWVGSVAISLDSTDVDGDAGCPYLVLEPTGSTLARLLDG
jgi:hypothetical protein